MKLRTKLGSVAAVAAIAALILSGCSPAAEGPADAQPLPDAEQNLTFVPAYGWSGPDISAFPLEIGVNMAISQTLETLIALDANSIPQPDARGGVGVGR